MSKPVKPLGRKAYGSIPHMRGSRIGPGEHMITDGQKRILTEKARDRHDRIIVTEKLDGANVAIANIDGQIRALSRAGYDAYTAKYPHLHMFGEWVLGDQERWREMLLPGETLHGEWLAMAHGTKYDLGGKPFWAFDLTTIGNTVSHPLVRAPYDLMANRCIKHGVPLAALLSYGSPMPLDSILPALGRNMPHPIGGDTSEGAVWRVEREGVFDFMAKWVRPDKVDGKYFDSPTWLWKPQWDSE